MILRTLILSCAILIGGCADCGTPDKKSDKKVEERKSTYKVIVIIPSVSTTDENGIVRASKEKREVYYCDSWNIDGNTYTLYDGRADLFQSVSVRNVFTLSPNEKLKIERIK